MNILLTAATEVELSPLLEYMAANWNPMPDGSFSYKGLTVSICITGVGMVATAYALTKKIAKGEYDFVLQAGIAGCSDRNISLGTMVWVADEQFGDLGAEDRENYLDVFELGLADKEMKPFSGGKLHTLESTISNLINLPKVSGLTLNTVSGHERTIEKLAKRYNCSVESMEGAAFHYVCLSEHLPFAQVRSISNYIEPRDRSKWQIGLAVKQLNEWMISFLQGIAA